MSRTGIRNFAFVYAVVLFLVGLLMLLNHEALQWLRIVNVPVDRPLANVIVWIMFWGCGAAFAYIGSVFSD